MSEIKTCEQYVLSRVEELENIVVTLQTELDSITVQSAQLKDRYDALTEILDKLVTTEEYTSNDGTHYNIIKIDDVWERHRPELYNDLAALLGLDVKRDLEEKEE